MHRVSIAHPSPAGALVARACAATAALWLGPGPASAQQVAGPDAGPVERIEVEEDDVRDTIVLADGGIVRGIITRWEPDVRVLIRTPDGQVHEYASSEVRTIEVGRIQSRLPLMPPPQDASATPRAHQLGAPHILRGGERVASARPSEPDRGWRFGPQIAIAAELYDHPWIGPNYYFDAGLVLHARLVAWLHVRGALFLWLDGRGTYTESSYVRSQMGAAGGRARLLLGADLGHGLATRVGGEAGFVFFEEGGHGDLLPVGAFLLEFGWRVFEGLGLGVVAGVTTRPGRRFIYDAADPTFLVRAEDHGPVGGRFGIELEYLF